VVARRGPDLTKALQALIGRQERLLARRDHAGFVQADREFHRTIVAAAGNLILERLYDSLRDRQRRMNAISIARDPTLAERFIEDHRAIAAALAAGDAAAAEDATTRHLTVAADGVAGAITPSPPA
jgi:DNA-binding GntR family transcriptional regulator